MEAIKNLVQQVRDYLSNPTHWVQDLQYVSVPGGEPQYCLAGAASAVAQGTLGTDEFDWFTNEGAGAFNQLSNELGFDTAYDMAAFNNSSTHAEVIALLDGALAAQAA